MHILDYPAAGLWQNRVRHIDDGKGTEVQSKLGQIYYTDIFDSERAAGPSRRFPVGQWPSLCLFHLC